MKISRTKLIPRKIFVRDAWLCVIATEGQETEKQYFDMFQSTRVKVEVLPTGNDGNSSTQAVYNRLERYQSEHEIEPEDQLWLMIDVDRWHNHLPKVCEEAKQNGVRLAVSNPCFELWLWLHHADVETGAIACKDIGQQLKQRIGGYKKNKVDLEKFRPYIDIAVQRAKSLDTNDKELWPAFPGTHVYKVIEALPISCRTQSESER